MRLWSLSLEYLDRQGLLAVWKEGIQAQNVLLKGGYIPCPECIGTGFIELNKACKKCKLSGNIKTPYYNHSQLIRFKANKDLSIYWITAYLYAILDEGLKRGYKFDKNKIRLARQVCCCMRVTRGQLAYEFEHLYKKLLKRDKKKAKELERIYLSGDPKLIEVHPLFNIIESPEIEAWEKVKKEK